MQGMPWPSMLQPQTQEQHLSTCADSLSFFSTSSLHMLPIFSKGHTVWIAQRLGA